jgi:MORN repeat
MAGERRLLLEWDPEIDGAFRRRFERALGELKVDAADALAVDLDPDAPAPVRVALVSISGSISHGKSDIVVLAGPGDFPATSGVLRLEVSDIEGQTRRWSSFVDQLSRTLGRASLAPSAEDLEVRLDEASRRADQAERALAEMERQRNDAVRAAKHADARATAESARIASLEQTLERLTALSEATTYAITSVPADLRAAVADAREHAWRARLAAARAAEAAEQHLDVLAWPKAKATYSGETNNRAPHGHGVIVFRDGAREIARYAGVFEEGRRSGHGVATSDGGHVWTGQWSGDEACGLGLLEAPDGSRFEGEVAASESGSPRQVRGWTWAPAAAVKSAQHLRSAPSPALPSPQAAGG